MSSLVLISHVLCPYVQRAIIVLKEKGVNFERRDIDLANKPDWFLAYSPLGKTPVLLVDDVGIFESAVICEYLEDALTPALHPKNILIRAHHRAWIEFGSSLLNTIAKFYNAKDEEMLEIQADTIRARLTQIERELSEGPWFAGKHFSMVDAVFGPIFRYFDLFDYLGDFHFFDKLPKTKLWRMELAGRVSVQEAVHPDYLILLREFIRKRDSALSCRVEVGKYFD
ncbi:glutathione S-transferase family protein [Acinetobacter sp.]|jgi:glutathione S-transferase|uniref:glutathione S-transferase family protein n=1 Tax=Acinetobacter sp. TaxID=472 RepID=UPI00282B508E|nr:glutathione S-transferase family protein [Acinetobacter sp.]MDR0236375.1 glutathione S-transferase family protein [Acinetobacter sp.]